MEERSRPRRPRPGERPPAGDHARGRTSSTPPTLGRPSPRDERAVRQPCRRSSATAWPPQARPDLLSAILDTVTAALRSGALGGTAREPTARDGGTVAVPRRVGGRNGGTLYVAERHRTSRSPPATGGCQPRLRHRWPSSSGHCSRPGRWSVSATACSRRRTPTGIASATTCTTGSARRWPGSARACRRCRRSWGSEPTPRGVVRLALRGQGARSSVAGTQPDRGRDASSAVVPGGTAGERAPAVPGQGAQSAAGQPCGVESATEAGPLRPTPVGAHGRAPQEYSPQAVGATARPL
jgi:hypothetical protein